MRTSTGQIGVRVGLQSGGAARVTDGVAAWVAFRVTSPKRRTRTHAVTGKMRRAEPEKTPQKVPKKPAHQGSNAMHSQPNPDPASAARHHPAEADSAFVTLPAHAGRAALAIEYRWLNPRASDAPLAVFLHEGLGSVAMWKDWPQSLCDRLGMRGLVYSRPGYGRSTPRPRDTPLPLDYLSAQARDVLPALLDALNVVARDRERMWVIGHSDGGSIALLYASAFPKALAGAVAIAPHIFVEDLSVAGVAQTTVAYEQKGLRNRLARYHADVDSAFYGWSDIWLSPAFRTWNIVNQLHAIQCPLLAVQGRDDHYATLAQIDGIADEVPHTRLVKLDHCGHSPHVDTPQALDDAIAAFVAASTS
jgi:pimeloyl-ACP methyl ester carboxylesterase